MKIFLENLDPSRSWAKFIDHKKWVFGICDPAINLVILIVKSYLCHVRSRNKDVSITALKRNFLAYSGRENILSSRTI